jgi:vacuolar protein sorting-associated protein 26
MSLSLFGFTTNPIITVNFDAQTTIETKKAKVAGQSTEDIVVYSGQESISGVVEISVPLGKKIEHLGIKIEMVGQIGE